MCCTLTLLFDVEYNKSEMCSRGSFCVFSLHWARKIILSGEYYLIFFSSEILWYKDCRINFAYTKNTQWYIAILFHSKHRWRKKPKQLFIKSIFLRRRKKLRVKRGDGSRQSLLGGAVAASRSLTAFFRIVAPGIRRRGCSYKRSSRSMRRYSHILKNHSYLS